MFKTYDGRNNPPKGRTNGGLFYKRTLLFARFCCIFLYRKMGFTFVKVKKGEYSLGKTILILYSMYGKNSST